MNSASKKLQVHVLVVALAMFWAGLLPVQAGAAFGAHAAAEDCSPISEKHCGTHHSSGKHEHPDKHSNGQPIHCDVAVGHCSTFQVAPAGVSYLVTRSPKGFVVPLPDVSGEGRNVGIEPPPPRG